MTTEPASFSSGTTISPPPPLVVLFKGTLGEEDGEETSEGDPYVREIIARFITSAPRNSSPLAGVMVIPVLCFERVPPSHYSTKDEMRFDSVIVTSPRAMWAVSGREENDPLLRALLKASRWFVVGESSAESVRAFLSERGLSAKVVGGDSGSAQVLFDRYILPTKREMEETRTTIAYLCGDLRRPTLGDLLRTNGFAFEEIVVYLTKPRADVILSSSSSSSSWLASSHLVFFSPSGIDAVVTSKVLNPEEETQRVYAIGETTANAIRMRTKWKLQGVAARPTPSALCDALSIE